VHKELKLGPAGRGWVQEVRTKDGTRYVARWNAYEMRDGVRVRVTCGPHELGQKVHAGPGLRSLAAAQKVWDKICGAVIAQHHSEQPSADTISQTPASADMRVRDFITFVYEPRRSEGLEPNSKINWEYYRDSFLVPFFGDRSITAMNNEDVVRSFMQEIAGRKFSEHTAKKAFTYCKAILDMARDLGITSGNAARLIPKHRRIPKGVVKAKSQGFITIEQFVALLNVIGRARDRIIVKILFLCAVRRSELFCIRWKDFVQQDGHYTLNIERSFCSRTHKIKEWVGKQAGNQEKAPAKVAVPPKLAEDLLNWGNVGDTDASDPESFIFPTRNDSCIIPTNWAEDVLKPAGMKIGIPDISYHWFRRGHATVQHHQAVSDKPIQGQLRHSKVETTRNIYMQQVAPETYKAVVNLEELVLSTEGQK
jgi:integrase